MATWSEFTAFVKDNFKVAEEGDDFMTLLFGLPDDRSQLVAIQHAVLLDDSEDWAIITSPIGKLSAVDAPAALGRVGNMVVGALAAQGEILVLKHSLPLANLDTNEFLRPLELVVGSADDLEKELVGGDDF